MVIMASSTTTKAGNSFVNNGTMLLSEKDDRVYRYITLPNKMLVGQLRTANCSSARNFILQHNTQQSLPDFCPFMTDVKPHYCIV